MTRRELRCVLLLAIYSIAACGGENGDPTSPPPFNGASSPASAASAAGSAATLRGDALPPANGSAAAPVAGSGAQASPAGAPTQPPVQSAEPGAPALAGTMPCSVTQALATNCQKCHGASPAFGAPMSLVTLNDFHQPSKTHPDKQVHELSLMRMTDTSAPMPPASAIGIEDKRTLVDWLSAGAAADPNASGSCEVGGRTRDPSYYKNGLTPRDGETCYEFRTHAGQDIADQTPYSVSPGEHYEQFYFAVPWGADQVMTRFGAKYDNLKVLHHWLLFTSVKPASQVGTHETTVGTTIGDTSQLIGGWAVGGDHVEFPADTGLELIGTGTLNAQWHYYNQGSSVEPDASIIQICTVPRSMRKNVGSLTFLGTENFNGPLGMPPKTESQFGGNCTNNSGGPITIFGFNPHMHKLGRNMQAVITRKDGTQETVFDKPFDFQSQITYILPKPVILEAGESIVSTCTFNNTTDSSVPFGPSSDQEMCYNFTMSYPSRALENGAASLIGATNVCW